MRDNGSTASYPPKTKEPRSFPTFPIGINYFIASGLLWSSVIFIFYKGYDYYNVHSTIDDTTLSEDCTAKPFGKNIAENQEKISSYAMGDSKPYLHRLGSEKRSGDFIGTPAPTVLSSLPPIVTAVASKDFFTVQGLIHQIKEEIAPMYSGTHLIVYDIGLYFRERELLMTYCNCEVRTFQAGVYPNHVGDFGTGAYRPLIIQLTLEEYGSVIWLSPSARFKTAGALHGIRQRGNRDFMVWDNVEPVPLIAYSSPKMFEFLKEPRCLYKGMSMIDLDVMVLYRTNTTWQLLMKPWLKCVLTENCIAPYYARHHDCFYFREPRYTGCHRFDQSAISIILNRAMQLTVNRAQYIPARIIKNRETGEAGYFPEQPWTYTQITSIIIVLCLIPGALYLYRWRQINRKKASYLKR